MKILEKRPVDVNIKYIYGAAALISVIVILQNLKDGENGKFFIEAFNVAFIALNYFTWALLINYINGIWSPIEKFPKNPILSLTITIIGTVLLVLIHLVISNIFYFIFLRAFDGTTFSESFVMLQNVFARALFSRLIDLLIILFILKLVDTYSKLNQRKTRVAELENQLQLAELNSLKAQLNPHFLFNSLHAVQTLIGHDDRKARSMIVKISALLRKMLDQRDRHIITMSEEMGNVKDYLEIEQERFHDRLKVRYDIRDETMVFDVPTLILQPVIENSFKHGISKLEGANGIIKISSFISQDFHVLMVSNSISKIHQKQLAESCGVGLTNIKNRLNETYSTDFHFDIFQHFNFFTSRIAIKIKA